MFECSIVGPNKRNDIDFFVHFPNNLAWGLDITIFLDSFEFVGIKLEWGD